MLVKSVLGALFLTLASSSCFAASDEVEWFRRQHFNACKKYFVGDVIENYLSNPKYESGIATDGDNIVNVRGKIAYNNKTVKAILQFSINPYKNKVTMIGFSINGEVQNAAMRSAIVQNMCESAAS